MFFHKSDLAVILHSLELLSPSRARRHRGHGLHGGHGSSRLDGRLVRHEPEENSLLVVMVVVVEVVVFCGGQENTLLNYTTLLGKLVMLFLAMVDGKGVTLEVS